MDEQKRALLDQLMKQQKGAAIIEGAQEKFRQDGYTNLLNKYGTKQDNSTAYHYNQEAFADDLELIRLYEGNGLFTKIIDRPSEEAVKHGLDIDYGDEDISEYIDDRMDDLEFEDKFATAEKWARLYGGSIIVMLVDDGRGLEEPLDWNNARSIEELRVFERAIVQPDYSSLYNFHFFDTMETDKPFAEPEYYQVFSLYGYFTVHRSRCLVFRNGRLPEQTTNAIYRYWGIPEYVKIKRALRECITSHEDGVKLLERSAQAIYKMKNLANMLSTSDGEDKVLQRLQVIDMARSILNSIAIDNDGEDYDFKTLQMSGVKDVIDATCNMLSAVTNIPQTILFGRSPAGMNSTGESDMENFYNMVENIQKQNMKKNVRTVIDLILKQGKLEGKIPEVPKYKVKFAPLWSLSDAEQVGVDQTKAQTEYTKAQTAQIYMDSSVIDPSEVRSMLAKEGDMEIEEMLSEESQELNLPPDTFNVGNSAEEVIRISGVDEGEDGGGDRGGDTQEVIRISGIKGEDDGNGRIIRILTSETNQDAGKGSGGVDWITLENGVHVPLKNGIAQGGPLKGKDFSSAKSVKRNKSEGGEKGKIDTKTISKISRNQAKNEWESADEEDRMAYIDDAREEYSDYAFSRNGTLANAIAAEEGLDTKPTSLSEDEFDSYVKETGSRLVYRGVQDLYDEDGEIIVSGSDIRKQFSTSDDSMYGGGNFGSGYHFSDSKSYAQGFARKSEGGELFECAIKPGASLMSHSTWENLPDSTKMEYDNDCGLYALTHGYDGIVSKTGVTNIVNRGALVYKTPENKDSNTDGADYPAAAVIIIHNGKILCASRRNNEGVCGPGGHVEEGESSEDAAVREAMEEFNVVPLSILPLGEYKGIPGLYLPSMVYFTDKLSGIPEADGDEMLDARWLSMEELRKERLYPPFEESLNMLIDLLSGCTAE